MENKISLEQEGYSISTDTTKLDIAVIHQYLSEESYWAKYIPIERVERSIENSLCFGVYHLDKQVGFARLVTDKASFAYLADVFVLEAYRGKGLSKWLMHFIRTYPEVQGIRRWLLFTKDAHGLYAQYDWKPIPEEQVHRVMQILDNEVYTNFKHPDP